MTEDSKSGYQYNIDMWSSNDRTELLRMVGGMVEGKDKGVLTEYSGKPIEIGKWYDVKIHWLFVTRKVR